MFIPENKAHHLVTALLLSSFLGQPLAAMAADNPVAPGEVDAATPVAPPDAAAAAEPAAADDTPNWQEITVTGDWGGARKRLYDAGVQADLLYTCLLYTSRCV